MKKWIVGVVVLTVALLTPAFAGAHPGQPGHAHKVMGTVSSIEGEHVMVKTTDGKTVMVMLDSKTKVTKGKTTLDAAALKVGDRIVAEGPEEKEMIMATSVKVGGARRAAKRARTAAKN
jgi:hypothetical protein